MAEDKSTPKAARLERFTWAHDELSERGVHIPGDAYARLASDAIDVGGGICSVLEILESNNIAEADGEPTLISKSDVFALLRLAQYAARTLNDHGSESLHWAYKHHTAAGRKEHAH